MEHKRQLVTWLQVKLLNPPVRALAARGLAPGVVLLETTGRKSGEPRRTPVSNGLEPGTDTFWIVAEMGRRAAYVRNIEADPHVRIRLRRGWRSGTAHVIDGDDPRTRLRTLSRLNAAGVRAMGTALLVIRVDLDPLRVRVPRVPPRGDATRGRAARGRRRRS
jgi:deazaflavin-dependent oxidoreductase (nitroreductase family)